MAELTDAQIDAALERGRTARLQEPRAAAARYDRRSGRVVVELANGCTFAFPPQLAQGLEAATEEHLSQVEIWGQAPGCTGRRSTPTCPSQACLPACSERKPTWPNKPDGRRRRPRLPRHGRTAPKATGLAAQPAPDTLVATRPTLPLAGDRGGGQIGA